jgi:hypothetical protein
MRTPTGDLRETVRARHAAAATLRCGNPTAVAEPREEYGVDMAGAADVEFLAATIESIPLSGNTVGVIELRDQPVRSTRRPCRRGRADSWQARRTRVLRGLHRGMRSAVVRATRSADTPARARRARANGPFARAPC